MFIKKITAQNFRLFSASKVFEVDEINIPDSINEGSGLTAFVGENGCGKTSLLDVMALPLLSYKADSFSLNDFNNPEQKVLIEIFSKDNFEVASAMPKGSFKSKGFSFEAGVRSRDNKAYLSSVVVSDQKYIKADGVEKPKDGSPDLRVSVNNPFKGQRFDENDILFLDRNRTYQTRSGTYNPTKFDRLMGDFDYQHIRNKQGGVDLNEKLDDIKKDIGNDLFENTIKKFEEISGSKITLNFIDNWRPFSKCFFAEQKENNQQIPLNMLGSGFEMIFSLLYSFYLSQQSGKQLIVLLDEPELHLHPSLLESFVKIVLEFSKTAQIVLCTHSPLFVKQLSYNKNVKIKILAKEKNMITVLPVEEKMLSYISSNEINYLAFRLVAEEYHNELYEELKYLKGDDKNIKQFDIDYFQSEKGEQVKYPWKGTQNIVSIHTFIRNQIHHQKDNGKATLENIKVSITTMRGFLKDMKLSEA